MHIFPFGGLEVHFLVWISQELPPAVGMRLVLNEIDFFVHRFQEGISGKSTEYSVIRATISFRGS